MLMMSMRRNAYAASPMVMAGAAHLAHTGMMWPYGTMGMGGFGGPMMHPYMNSYGGYGMPGHALSGYGPPGLGMGPGYGAGFGMPGLGSPTGAGSIYGGAYGGTFHPDPAYVHADQQECSSSLCGQRRG